MAVGVDHYSRRVMGVRAFLKELAALVAWFNAERPHTLLRGAPHDEVYFAKMPAHRRPRFEPRKR